MGFGIARGPLLTLLADAMEVPEARRSAFLGRFQHLQRLELIDGINPGRGKAAEYQAHHVMLIAITMQMLQLGLTPERAVAVVQRNYDRIQLSIAKAVENPETIGKSLIWFDPAILTQTGGIGDRDLAEITLDWGAFEHASEIFSYFYDRGFLQRSSFISVGNTLWALIRSLDGDDSYSRPPVIGPKSEVLLSSLRDWGEPTTAAILERHRRENDLRILKEMVEEGSSQVENFASAVGLKAELQQMIAKRDG